MDQPKVDIAKLTQEQRLELIERLWESLRTDDAVIPMTDAQRAELDRRLDEFERDGDPGIPLEDVLARFQP